LAAGAADQLFRRGLRWRHKHGGSIRRRRAGAGAGQKAGAPRKLVIMVRGGTDAGRSRVADAPSSTCEKRRPGVPPPAGTRPKTGRGHTRKSFRISWDLDQFTVNLAREGGRTATCRQVSLDKIASQSSGKTTIKEMMPAARRRKFLLVLSGASGGRSGQGRDARQALAKGKSLDRRQKRSSFTTPPPSIPVTAVRITPIDHPVRLMTERVYRRLVERAAGKGVTAEPQKARRAPEQPRGIRQRQLGQNQERNRFGAGWPNDGKSSTKRFSPPQLPDRAVPLHAAQSRDPRSDRGA